MKDIVVLMNPEAGGGEAAETMRELLGRYADVELVLTERPGHATDLALEASEAGARIVAAAGGDGTVHEVVQGIRLAGSRAALGLVPLGTGNDLARSLGIEADPAKALDVLVNGRTRRLDVVHAVLDGEERTFINAASGGFAGKVGEAADAEVKRRWGPLSYLRGAIEAIGELTPWAVRLEIDGREHRSGMLNVVIANGGFAGHGVRIAPRADPFDGLLNVAAILEAPLLRISRMAPKLLAGEDPGDELFLAAAGRHVLLEVDRPMPFSIDGEQVEVESGQFRLEPGALDVVVPAAVGEKPDGAPDGAPDGRPAAAGAG